MASASSSTDKTKAEKQKIEAEKHVASMRKRRVEQADECNMADVRLRTCRICFKIDSWKNMEARKISDEEPATENSIYDLLKDDVELWCVKGKYDYLCIECVASTEGIPLYDAIRKVKARKVGKHLERAQELKDKLQSDPVSVVRAMAGHRYTVVDTSLGQTAQVGVDIAKSGEDLTAHAQAMQNRILQYADSLDKTIKEESGDAESAVQTTPVGREPGEAGSADQGTCRVESWVLESLTPGQRVAVQAMQDRSPDRVGDFVRLLSPRWIRENPELAAQSWCRLEMNKACGQNRLRKMARQIVVLQPMDVLQVLAPMMECIMQKLRDVVAFQKATDEMLDWMQDKEGANKIQEKLQAEGTTLVHEIVKQAATWRAFKDIKDPDQRDRLQRAADFTDEWYRLDGPQGGSAFRTFYVCRAGGEWPCNTMTLSSCWDRKHTDPLQTGQKWFCQCGAKYRVKFGLIVELALGGQSYYLRGSFPPDEWVDVKAMKIAEDYGTQIMTAEDLLGVIPLARPMGADFLMPIAGWPHSWKMTQENYEELPEWSWDDVLAIVKFSASRAKM